MVPQRLVDDMISTFVEANVHGQQGSVPAGLEMLHAGLAQAEREEQPWRERHARLWRTLIGHYELRFSLGTAEEER
jgi:hypothetical protein